MHKCDPGEFFNEYAVQTNNSPRSFRTLQKFFEPPELFSVRSMARYLLIRSSILMINKKVLQKQDPIPKTVAQKIFIL